MQVYVGILDGMGSTWGVRIPDIDGCVGAGASPKATSASVTRSAFIADAARRKLMSAQTQYGIALAHQTGKSDVVGLHSYHVV